VEAVSILLVGGVFLVAAIVAIVALVCAIIVFVKMCQNDQVVLAVLGLFVPLVLFVVGWIQSREWRITGTMITWTLTMILAPILGVGAGLMAVAAGLTMWGALGSMAMPGVTGVQDDPGTLTQFSGQVGRVMDFEVRGNPTGTIYGTDVYTDDSALATAAVHAGVLKDGERGVVRVTMLPGQASYPASQRNGVTSNDWGHWGSSYRVAAARDVKAREAEERPVQPDAGALEPVKRGPAQLDPGTLSSYRGSPGQVLYFEVVGAAGGPVWGTDVYTDDSQLATAAVHAGVLKPGQKGVVKVTMLGGQNGYPGSTRHGVSSGNWGFWGASYRVEAAR
jgi:LCCL domain